MNVPLYSHTPLKGSNSIELFFQAVFLIGNFDFDVLYWYSVKEDRSRNYWGTVHLLSPV